MSQHCTSSPGLIIAGLVYFLIGTCASILWNIYFAIYSFYVQNLVQVGAVLMETHEVTLSDVHVERSHVTHPDKICLKQYPGKACHNMLGSIVRSHLPSRCMYVPSFPFSFLKNHYIRSSFMYLPYEKRLQTNYPNLSKDGCNVSKKMKNGTTNSVIFRCIRTENAKLINFYLNIVSIWWHQYIVHKAIEWMKNKQNILISTVLIQTYDGGLLTVVE